MLSTVVGVALILLALRDIFDTLFHPHGRGVISERVVRLVWIPIRALARTRVPVALTLAGPVAFSAVLAMWVGMVTLGGALIIEPNLSDGYDFAPGIDPASYSGLVDAVSISLVNLTSLGYGDAVASGSALRILGPLQSLIGLVLITASLSWILSIYRVITSMALLAREAGSTVGAAGFEELSPFVQWPALDRLSSSAAEARRNLLHFPISYYFHRRDSRGDLSVALPPVLEICRRLADRSSDPAVAFHARRLIIAIDELAETVGEEFLSIDRGDAEDVFRRWREDHLWDA